MVTRQFSIAPLLRDPGWRQHPSFCNSGLLGADPGCGAESLASLDTPWSHANWDSWSCGYGAPLCKHPSLPIARAVLLVSGANP